MADWLLAAWLAEHGVLIAIRGPRRLAGAAYLVYLGRAAGSLPVPLQMLVLGALLPAIGVILDGLWAAAAGTGRHGSPDHRAGWR